MSKPFFTAASFLAIVMLASASVGCSADASSAPDTTDDGTGRSEDELKARFTLLRSGPTNKDLNALYAAGSKFEWGFIGAYRFNRAGAEATDPEARHKRIKEVMHRYMCGFFDESIDIGRNTGSTANRVKVALSDLNMRDNSGDQADDAARFEDALTTVYGDSQLDVLTGSASGNNTFGEVMGIYDIKRNEVLYFGFTNCGRDD